jgi:hypothetical protein
MGHLQDIGETYWQHLRFAGLLSLLLFKAAFAALIHAIVPTIFVTTASDTINEINYLLKERNAEPEELDEDKELFI